MNGTNSTPLSSRIYSFLWITLLIFATQSSLMAQTPSCACKGSIQVSVDENCEAVITAGQILANESTCDGDGSIVTLMKTPTSGIIATGVGSAELLDARLYLGKTIYGKVSTENGLNSCWTTILVEDKMKPQWEKEIPDTLVVTCPSLGSVVPNAIDNCKLARVYQVGEDVVINNCNNDALFAGPDTIKMIERKFRAIDEFGNISDTECSVVYFVIAVGTRDLLGVVNKELECDANYQRITSGPYAGHPAPTALGSGAPFITPWTTATRGAGKVDINPTNGNLRLSGGTDAGTTSGLGAQACIVATSTGTFSFNWSAEMKGSTPPPGNFAGDHAQYRVNNNPWTNLTTGGAGSGATPQSGNASIPVVAGDEICFRVVTNNNNRWTELMVSSITGPIPSNTLLNPDNSGFCNLFITFEDTKFPTIKCVTKIMRKWQVIEWSCNSSIKEFIQIIEIIDSKAPEFITINEHEKVSTNAHICQALYKVQKPILRDNCSSTKYNVTAYDNEGKSIGFLQGLTATSPDRYLELPVGCNTVVYTAFDDCHNQSEYITNVTVEDWTAPVAICKQNTVVGLTNEGKAWVPASSLDNGSYDDCDLAKVLIRRMDPVNCQPCKIPELPGFTYLGEYTSTINNKPHYYYASKHKATPEIAHKTALAVGGYVANVDNGLENTWIYNKVKEWNLGENYLIGYVDQHRNGTFKWTSGQTTTYTNWASSYPFITSPLPNRLIYTGVFDSDATWFNFEHFDCEASEYIYVVEIEDPCGFDTYAQFCCADLGGPQMVQLRAIDKSGNYNDCMVNVVVQDKSPLTITCPKDEQITCDYIFDINNLSSQFGRAVSASACASDNITETVVTNLNSCRIGTIKRTFTAIDAAGRTASCTQTITVTGSSEFTMTEQRWPTDKNITMCVDPDSPQLGPDFMGRPDLTSDNICSLAGATYKDDIFYFNNPTGEACFKILRNWIVIDWCQPIYSTGGGVTYREWVHTQVIKVHDTEAPQIVSDCSAQVECTYDPNCNDGYIELSARAIDNCTQQLAFTYRIDLFNDKQFELLTGGSFDPRYSKSGLATVTQQNVNVAALSGNFPVGTHRVVWIFEDRCGNLASCEQLFTIMNCKAPTPYCINGLATSLMPMDDNNDGIPDRGEVDIWAKDFDLGSAHPCGNELLFSFTPITLDANNRPVLTMSRRFTCQDRGRNNLDVYVGFITPDHKIVQDYCSTFITVQDNFNVCTDNRLIVDGSLMTEENVGLENAVVDLMGSEMSMQTIKNGIYNFANVDFGGSYEVAPSKNDDLTNGISTLDIILIQRHVLGIEKITSPYKLIAADINRDKSISVRDMNELRKVVLGVADKFESNNSWRFIDKAYQFNDNTQAHVEAFPETYNIDRINQDMTVDFMAVKVGDINGNASASLTDQKIEARSKEQLSISLEDKKFSQGELVDVVFRATENSNISGFQMTIRFDNDRFSLASIDGKLANMTDNNFGLQYLNDGAITVSFGKESAINVEKGQELFAFTFTAKNNGNVANNIWVSSDITKAEAYDAELNVMNVVLDIESRKQGITQLYQNTPNPFKSATLVGFELESDGIATLTVYDLNGKALKVYGGSFVKGYNSIEVNTQELGVSGVLYYTLEAGDFTATRKMVVIE